MSETCKLIELTPFPPGSFSYSQTVNGILYSFPDIGLDIQNQGMQVAKFRKANGFPRATIAEAIDDINIYTCARLGCDPRFCTDGTVKAPAVIKTQSPGECKGCGAKV